MTKERRKLGTHGHKIKTVRKELNLSLTNLADKLKMSVHTIKSYELNHNEPSIKFLKALAEKLNVNIHWFIFDEEPMFTHRHNELAQYLCNRYSLTSRDLTIINEILNSFDAVNKNQKDLKE